MSAPSIGVDLTWKPCRADGCQGAGLGLGHGCLSHLDAAELSTHLEGFSRGRALDARGVRVGPELLAQIVQAAPLDGTGRPRLAGIRFDGAVLHDLCLDDIVFGGDVCFDGAELSGAVSFRRAVFEGAARFAGARFGGHPDFEGATFAASAWFAGASFAGDVSFADATFAGPVRFSEARFAAGAGFEAASFASHASFEAASFEGHADFSGAAFADDASFLRAVFAGTPTFGGARFTGPAGVPEVALNKGMAWSGPPLAPWPRRAAAALIDHAVPAGIFLVAALAAGGLSRIQHDALAPFALGAGGLATLAFLWANLAGQGRTGQSLGKRRMGLRLLGEASRRPVGVRTSLVRQVLHLVLDTMPLATGWLWPLHDSRRRTFADKASGTVVVTVGTRWHGANRAKPPPPPAGGGSGCC